MLNQFVRPIFVQHRLVGHVMWHRRDGRGETAWRNSALLKGVLITTIKTGVVGEEGFQK